MADTTIGGRYLVAGQWVDANGRPLPAPEPPPATPTEKPATPTETRAQLAPTVLVKARG